MTHVIDKSRIGTNASGRDERPPGIHPASDASAFAADGQFHISPDERINRAPNVGHGAAMSNAPADPRASEPADDSGQGLAMLVIFTAAALIVTGAVALLALVNSWWMLGVAFAVHVAMTAVVMLAILHAMAGHTRAIAVRDRLSPAQDRLLDGRSRAHTEQVAARGRSGPQPLPAIVPDRGSVSHADRPGVPNRTAPMRPRVRMVTEENLAEANEVPAPIRPLVDLAEEVYVVAPTLTTRLQSLTGDVDRARASADDRLRTVFDHMHADGLEPRGVVGDEDQVTAIADALTGFDADLMVLRLHAEGSEHENWREHRLVKRVRSRFDLPTIAFFFDSDGHVVGREAGQTVTPAMTSPSENHKPTLGAAG
ncbi:MAG: hypothetical protein ACRDPA_23475 [Solirubrobacteraceae bacterium]